MTLASVPGEGGGANSRAAQGRFDTSTLQITEHVLHSLSNIEEKLHQSYYLYVMQAPPNPP